VRKLREDDGFELFFRNFEFLILNDLRTGRAGGWKFKIQN